MAYRHILDIPVYRCGAEQLTKELDAEKHCIQKLNPYSRNADPTTFEEDRRSIGVDLYYCWEFNEIVGWIRLEVFGSLSNLQFRGMDFWVKSKVIKRG